MILNRKVSVAGDNVILGVCVHTLVKGIYGMIFIYFTNSATKVEFYFHTMMIFAHNVRITVQSTL